jgi:hypothetical protein
LVWWVACGRAKWVGWWVWVGGCVSGWVERDTRVRAADTLNTARTAGGAEHMIMALQGNKFQR